MLCGGGDFISGSPAYPVNIAPVLINSAHCLSLKSKISIILISFASST
jgi:hypothetical protein